MALTDAQKTAIKRHLGYHAVAQSRYPLVEGFSSVTQVLTDLPAETEAEVVAILGRLAALESRLDAAPDNLTLSVAEDVEFRGPGELEALWGEIRRWRIELSTLLGLPMRRAGASIPIVVV